MAEQPERFEKLNESAISESHKVLVRASMVPVIGNTPKIHKVGGFAGATTVKNACYANLLTKSELSRMDPMA